MKSKFPAIIICALSVLAVLAAAAFAVPQVINYQGELSDSSGNPVNGDVSVVFAIYNAPAGGDVLWSETQTVTVADGVFNVLLGVQNALSADVFDHGDTYLGVKVDTDAEMSPRQLLASVPYAFAAEKAGCYSGDFINCYTGPQGTLDVGVCAAGTRNCNADGMGFAPDCVGEVLPSAEVCDYVDNDCSGEADETGCAACMEEPALCDDAVACTTDACDPITGCSSTPDNALCDDAVICTVDACHPVMGCTFTPDNTVCDDPYPCTINTCDPLDGDPFSGCLATPDDGACNDGVACTTDTCDLGSGCTYTPNDAACNDGIACTIDTCEQFSGCTYTADSGYCNDANECTDDVCDQFSGCEFSPVSPGTPCTGGTCDGSGNCI
jgi:hypothetical protein